MNVFAKCCPCLHSNHASFNPVKSLKSFFGKVTSTVQKTISVAASIKEDTNCLARVLKLGGYTLGAVEIITGRRYLPILANMMGNADNLIDTVQVLADVNYWVSGDVFKDWKIKIYNAKYKVCAFVSFFFADTIGAVLWLDELKFISLAKIAAKIESKFPAFKFISQIGLGTICRGIVGVAFAFYWYDAQKRINLSDRNIKHLKNELSKDVKKVAEQQKRIDKGIKEAIAEKKKAEGAIKHKTDLCKRIEIYAKHAKWERAWAITEVAFKVFALAGGGVLLGGLAMAGFGIAAASLGIGAFAYRTIHSKLLDGLERELPIAM